MSQYDFMNGRTVTAEIEGEIWGWSELLDIYDGLPEGRRQIALNALRDGNRKMANLHRLHAAIKQSGHLLVKKRELMDDAEYNEIIAAQEIVDGL